MALKDTLRIVDRMAQVGIIGPYAICGAVAAYNYIEAAITEDLDLLIALSPSASGLISLTPITGFLADAGYRELLHEGILVEGWPIRFIPVASDLEMEALERSHYLPGASVPDIEAVRILRPEHLVAMALKIGRPKDRLRIAQFLEEDAVDHFSLCDVLRRHSLLQTWEMYCLASGTGNFCER